MDNISLYAFLVFVVVLLVVERRRFKREGIAFLRRTSKGIERIRHYAEKYRTFLNFLADIGVSISYGFLSLYYIAKDKNLSTAYKVLHLVIYGAITYLIFIKTPLIEDSLRTFFDPTPTFAVVVMYAFSLIFGVGGMAFSLILLGSVSVLYNYIFALKDVAPPLQIVVPFSVPKDTGLPFFSVPFDKWLISILVIVVVHEIAHAIIALANKIKVKSLGYGFLLVIPLGFAEPDEKSMSKKPILNRLRVYAAGSFSNFIFALVFGLLFVGVNYAINVIDPYEFEGIAYNGLVNNTYAYTTLPKEGIITHVEGKAISNFSHLIEIVYGYKPNDTITLTINGENYTLKLSANPNNTSLPFIGIKNLVEKYTFKESIENQLYYKIFLYILLYLSSLLMWLSLLNLGIGIANLIPTVPLDGGLMIRDMLPTRVGVFVSIISLALLLFSIFGKWIIKLFL